MEEIISTLIAKLVKLKQEHGDLVVCINDENVGFIPLFESGVDIHEVLPATDDGIYDHRANARSSQLEKTAKIVCIQWSC
jgi:hypothetical protein